MNAVDELLERFLSGEATADETVELQKLLRADAGNRRRLVDAFLLDVQLFKALACAAPASPPIQTKWRRVASWIAAAAVLLVTIGGLTFYFWPSEHSSRLDSGQVRVEGVQLTEIPDGKNFIVGGDKPAFLRLSDGSHAVLDVQTEGVIHGEKGEARQVVELSHGGGTFNVKDGASNFRVDTPLGSVTAIGTEFSVRLRKKSPAKDKGPHRVLLDVSVAQGSVNVNSAGADHVLAAGKNRVFGDDGEQNNRDDGEQNNGQRNQGNQGNQGKKK
jgi:ferric-dicitrate binding protein FerR (iron transport regulator)